MGHVVAMMYLAVDSIPDFEFGFGVVVDEGHMILVVGWSLLFIQRLKLVIIQIVFYSAKPFCLPITIGCYCQWADFCMNGEIYP